jgi:hypothetical protein
MWKLLMNFLPQADLIYVVLFLGVGGLGAYYVHKYHAAMEFESTVRAESVDAQVNALKIVADNTASYKAALAAEKAQHASDLLTASNQHNSDVARLRSAATGQVNPVLGGTPAAPAGSAGGAVGPASVSGLSEQAVVCQGLSDALRHDGDILAGERAERDALTGK